MQFHISQICHLRKKEEVHSHILLSLHFGKDSDEGFPKQQGSHHDKGYSSIVRNSHDVAQVPVSGVVVKQNQMH
nr:hypothetical protein Iba_scaffold2431CG0210 [Ipomoea batatas]GME14669.1 hypothetical protein Iba_scaffold15375CG0030 [Ipomoea batatas]GME15873.1 hypothetical protein Iba_scaffold16863CG0020 [Ipomoea batatas]